MVNKVIYYKNNWGVLSGAVLESNKSLDDVITIVGGMPGPIQDEIYNATVVEKNNTNYGKQYEIKSISLDVNISQEKDKRDFLLRLYTENQVQAMYDALPDPFAILQNKDVESLLKVKGCGLYRAEEWCRRFDQNYSLIRLYTELPQYHLSMSMIDKLMKKYRSPDIIISKIKNNPYSLCEVHGFGWKTVDQIALQSGMKENDPKRVAGFITFYLQDKAYNGISWVTSEELMNAILKELGEELPDQSIAAGLRLLKDQLWFNENKTRFALQYYYNMEEQIATHLLRILNSKTKYEAKQWEEIVHQQEVEQGWNYTDQQIEGIKAVLDNNVVVIHGLAGCGKTTIVNVVLKIFEDRYSYAMCALAGRASVRLTSVTGNQGFTIHSLLGVATGEDSAGYFIHDESNPLPYDIIIVDEISMIGGSLFLDLLKAVKTGAKLILLGDIGQLESIGECKVAVDIINSPEIPTVYLDKIHRQAQKSAIITESIKMRKGVQIINQDDAGVFVRGELQDLTLDLFSDKSNTFAHVMQHVAFLLEQKVNILDMQVVCPTKERGEACNLTFNLAIQELYNPSEKGKKSIQVRNYELRVGDKIINMQNSKRCFSVDGEKNIAIYNGNIGIIHDITPEEDLIIDFLERGRVLVPHQMVNQIELGYSITVHKMQGDQKEYVIGAIDFSSYNMLSRELLYTLVTRAIKKCILVAQNSALYYATGQEGNRNKRSFLQDILYRKTHEKFNF